MSEHLEIERKYLIAMPDTRALRAACSHVYEMEQTYLAAAPGVTARVRRRQEGERVEYFYTEKEFRTDRTCVERERAVTEEEYHRLLVRRREKGVTLRKTRWCMLYAGRVLEIELPDEGAPVSIPPQIRILREVTADRRLKNAVLAQRIPDERELLAETSEN